MRRPSGMTLIEVMVALVLLGLTAAVAARAAAEVARATGVARRWTEMASLADETVVTLARSYRTARPGCVPPAGGSRVTADGIAIEWSVVGDSGAVEVSVVTRGRAAGRVLADTVATRLRCR